MLDFKKVVFQGYRLFGQFVGPIAQLVRAHA